MTWVTKLEASNLEKSWSPILNKLNVEWWNWTKNQLYKRIQNKKKIANMRLRTEFKIKKKWVDNIEFWIENEIQIHNMIWNTK
jgi:hypothetical protein